MTRVAAYTDRPSVAPGDSISCHVSLLDQHPGGASVDYAASLGRVTGAHGWKRSERITPILSAIDGRRLAEFHPVSAGSYGVATIPLAGPAREGLTLQVLVCPTHLDGRRQIVMSVCEGVGDDLEHVALEIAPGGQPELSVQERGGQPHQFALETPLEEGRWYRVVGRFSRLTAELEVTPLDGSGEAARQQWSARLPEFRSATVFLACGGVADSTGLRGHHMFTGRLEQPVLARAGIGERELAALVGEHSPTPRDLRDVIAAWDFGCEPASHTITDVSGRGNHGELFGLPIRAVTGAEWDGVADDPAAAPGQFRAIQFVSDAVEDAGWPAAFTLEVPEDLRSGVYAFILEADGGEVDTVPFVVTAGAEPQSDLLLILPTATYMAYSNTRFTWERVNWEIQQEQTVCLGPRETALVEHPEFGASSYDLYRDGSNVAHVSWRRPNLDLRSDQQRGENYPSDLQLIRWLEDEQIAYDVATDHDVDAFGDRLLGRYRAVVTGTHPEYLSSRGCDCLARFIERGGRMAVLGGNAYHFLVAFSDERPWIMEVRKSDHRPGGSRAAAELHLALTGEVADPSDDEPRPSESFLRTSTASMGFDDPRPYERLEASNDPRFAYIFDGVDDLLIGTDGILGGAVLQEWDNTVGVAGSAPIVLARSNNHSVNTRWFGATKRRCHAEMTYFTNAAGGAVFSAASMGWCLCLDDPPVSRVTRNVLERFMSEAPLEAAT